MTAQKKTETKTRALKLTVPEPLAAEIRRLADLSRRSAQEVAETVFGEIFADYTPAHVGTAWMKRLQGEIWTAPPSTGGAGSGAALEPEGDAEAETP